VDPRWYYSRRLLVNWMRSKYGAHGEIICWSFPSSPTGPHFKFDKVHPISWHKNGYAKLFEALIGLVTEGTTIIWNQLHVSCTTNVCAFTLILNEGREGKEGWPFNHFGLEWDANIYPRKDGNPDEWLVKSLPSTLNHNPIRRSDQLKIEIHRCKGRPFPWCPFLR